MITNQLFIYVQLIITLFPNIEAYDMKFPKLGVFIFQYIILSLFLYLPSLPFIFTKGLHMIHIRK